MPNAIRGLEESHVRGAVIGTTWRWRVAELDGG